MVKVLIRPIITEKSMTDSGSNRFTFEVAKSASKLDIKRAVEEEFKVNVLDVRTISVHGKKKRVGKRRRELVKSRSWKKAVVKLSPGQKIDLFEAGKE